MSHCPQLAAAAHPRVQGPVVAVVMDGIGVGRGDAGDAVAQAHTPNLQYLKTTGLYTTLRAHGQAVGMPSDDDMGNSEVGHNALGAGRIFAQGASLVAEAIQTGRMFLSPLWLELMGRCVNHERCLHFIGLLSDGNVHSHIDHLLAMIQKADAAGIKNVAVHTLLDGRDVPKTSALTYVAQLEQCLSSINARKNRDYVVASGGGRMRVTMDRYEADWPMVELGWQTHVRGQGRGFSSLRQAIELLRTENPGIQDQELPAFVIHRNGRAVRPIVDGDAVVLFNFRGDRMLELVRTFEDPTFDKFVRGPVPDVLFCGMTLYDGDTRRPKRYLVEPPEIRCTLGELLCDAGLRQLACSETQKFGHVTYFWNGNRSGMFDPKKEKYIEIPSRPPPFDAAPKMRAAEIAETVCHELRNRTFDFARINFANGDMVGHTGNFSATKIAVEAVDQALGLLIPEVMDQHGALLVTADHGNAEEMYERDRKTGVLLSDATGFVPKTSHSLNPVPCFILLTATDRGRFSLRSLTDRGLGNIAPTLLTLLGFATPETWQPSLIDARRDD